MTPKRIAITRSPGGLPGLDAHVGVWMAMEDAGIVPAAVCGCSAGAMVSALQATGMRAAAAADILRGLATEDVIRKRWAWKARAFWIDHFCDPSPIERLLEQLLPATFEELSMPLVVSATEMRARDEATALFREGPHLRQAVRASMSIAGVWPYAEIDGRRFTDGGTSDAIVAPPSMSTGEYDEVWVVNLYDRRSYAERDKNMISRLLWNVSRLMEFERISTREQWEAWGRNLQTAVRWLDIDCAGTSCLEFDHSLIGRAYGQTIAQLERTRA